MEGWDLLRSLHIKVNVIGMLGSPALQVGRAPAGWGAPERVEPAHKGSGAVV